MGLLLLILLSAASLEAAPFAKVMDFTQPNGQAIQLWGEGDEFQAVFETLDGYTVVFVPEDLAYHYARLSADGTVLESTGSRVGAADPAQLGLEKHLRMDPTLASTQARARRLEWDQQTGLSQRWQTLKEQMHDSSGYETMSPPSKTTLGVKCGLCLLIDFDNDPATIPQANIVSFLNADSYTGYGNNGSVKQYFKDVSNNKLTYTNVVTVYIRIPNTLHPKSYYNDVTKGCGSQANLLIRDAITILKQLPNYTTEILPKFASLTMNSDKTITAVNVFYAGGNGGVWNKGLWPHSYGLYEVGAQELSSGGKKISGYQITNIGSSLELGTFCHENGHMLCGFPDIYDYDYDSTGGAGQFCLMNSGGSGTNPNQVCAYLKLAAGWGTATDLTVGANPLVSVASSGANFNKFFRFRKTGVTTEYYLVENRQKAGRDVNLPCAGLAIWHIDELGSADNQSTNFNTTHANYEVTLVQADNKWHFQKNENSGDAQDLWFKGNSTSGYANAFSDLTSPCAFWWDGTRSGINFTNFSVVGTTMTFNAGVKTLMIRRDPISLVVNEGDRAALAVITTGTGPYTYQWYKNNVALQASTNYSGIDTATLTINPAALTDSGSYRLVVTGPSLSETSRVATLTVKTGPKMLSLDIGTAKQKAGTTTMTTSGYTVAGAGNDIGSTADGFRFVYLQTTNDVDVKVQITSLDDVNEWTKAGLMLRESLVAGSRHTSILTTPSDGQEVFQVVSRSILNSATTEQFRFGGVAYPKNWLRLKREGNLVTFYRSSDGVSWFYVRSVNINTWASAYVGMVVSSHNTTTLATAAFDKFTIQTNTLTTVSILATDSQAQEGTLDTGRVTVYASRNGPLDVSVRMSATAIVGSDFLPVPDVVSIPEGTNAASIEITPLNDEILESPETLRFTLQATTNTTLAQPSSAVVLLFDDEKKLGGLRRDVFNGLEGNNVADLTNQIKYPLAPDEVNTVAIFESYHDARDNYGQVLSGYFVPLVSGVHYFYIASDDASQLWLSTDDKPANARIIAQENNSNGYRNYGANNGSTTHQSAGISLVKGKYYYIKAIQKEGSGGDNLSVAVRQPGGAIPSNGSAPIPATMLAWAPPVSTQIMLVPQLSTVAPAPGAGAVQVTSAVTWTAYSTVPWIVITNGASGTGDGEVQYQVLANPESVDRAGLVVVNDRTHCVFQKAGVHLSLGTDETRQLLMNMESSRQQIYVIQASSNLLDWEDIYTNNVFTMLNLTNIDATMTNHPVRFYRVIESTTP